jgi:hypothetical protein
MVSHCINLYGLTSKKKGPEVLDDFLWEEGAPNILWSDNSKMQWGQECGSRDYVSYWFGLSIVNQGINNRTLWNWMQSNGWRMWCTCYSSM